MQQYIVAICGFKIAIIAGVLLAGGRQMVGTRIAVWIAVVAVIVYTIFVGAEASVVRAAVLRILMILAATLLGHPTFLPAVLFSAAFIMALHNPDILWDAAQLRAHVGVAALPTWDRAAAVLQPCMAGRWRQPGSTSISTDAMSLPSRINRLTWGR
jgi:hypothetical protein